MAAAFVPDGLWDVIEPLLMGDNQNSRPTTIRIPDQRQ